MYQETLQNLGLAKNEARIYQTLIAEGESSVGHIADKSKIHRRNVYDCVQRLIEKGLVFEIIEKRENRYKAVDPKKFSEILYEKQVGLNKILPDLERLYHGHPSQEAVYIYRGLEGWKNYMRDILRKGQDDYIIGGKGVWADPKIKPFTEQFAKQAKNKGIKFHMLFVQDNKQRSKQLADLLKAEYRYLPIGLETPSDIEVFADQVVIIADASEGVLRDELSLTVIINQKIADSFRVWFKALWQISKK